MIPGLSATAFWDIEFDKLDPEKNLVFILEKVYNYGLWDDYMAISHYYGYAIIKANIVKGSYYKKKVLSFLCCVFDLKPSDFLCYSKRQLQNPHWDY